MENERLIADIKALIADRNKSYSMISRFLLSKDFDDVGRLKIKDVEENCHVSATTVIRYCKRVHTKGFSELKYRLVEEKKEEDKICVVNDTQFSIMASQYRTKVIHSFMETEKLLSIEKLETILDFIHGADTISIYGGGSSYLVAQDLEVKLDRIKKHCKAYNDNSHMRYSSKNADCNSLAIGISYSGLTLRVIENLSIAKQQNAKTILFTSNKNSYFEGMFDVTVYISSSEIRDRVMSTNARLTMLYLIDLIYYSYVNSHSEECTQILINTR